MRVKVVIADWQTANDGGVGMMKLLIYLKDYKRESSVGMNLMCFVWAGS